MKAQADGGFPELVTSRLRLRELAPEDTEAVFACLALPEVARWTDLEPMTDRGQARDFVDRLRGRFHAGTGQCWALEELDTGAFVGELGFNVWDPARFSTDLGYMLAPPFHGRGLATEAAAAALRWGFDEFDGFQLNRVEAMTDPENVASRRVLTKLGFRLEGVLRQHVFEKGRFVDECLYSLLRDDPRPA